MGQETVNRGTDRPTGMHRPWGDFCVYRSTLTPGAESERGVQRAKERGLHRFFVSLSLFLSRVLPFHSSRSLCAQSRFSQARAENQLPQPPGALETPLGTRSRVGQCETSHICPRRRSCETRAVTRSCDGPACTC